MFAMMHRYEHPFSVVLLDIDRFQQMNDEQGHLYGDRMLKSVARLLDDSVRDTDLVARHGGEEFVIVMPQTMLDGATFSPSACDKESSSNCRSLSAAAFRRRSMATIRKRCWPAPMPLCTAPKQRAAIGCIATPGRSFNRPRKWCRRRTGIGDRGGSRIDAA